MKLSLETRLFIFFAVILSVILLLTWEASYNKSHYQDTVTRVQHTQEILFQSEGVSSKIADIESGMRGYVITGDDAFLASYHTSSKNILSNLSKLKTLTADNPGQQKRLDSLTALINDKINFSNHVIQQRSVKGFDEAQKMIKGGKGLEYMTSIQNMINRFQNEENRLLDVHEAANQKSINEFNFVFIIELVIIVVSAIFSYFIMRRNLKRRVKAEEELNTFFNISIDMIGIAATDGYFKKINPAFEKVLGYTQKEFLSKPFIEFIHPDDVTSTIHEVEKLSAGIPTLNFENRYLCKDGNYKWLEWTAVPVGESLYTVARDATQRKKNEEQLKELNKELESFTYSVSHDLRAPLRIINGYAELIGNENGSLNEDVKRMLGNIMVNSKRMGNLIDDLLNFSRLGRRDVVTHITDMNFIVHEIVEEQLKNPHASKYNIKINDLPKNVCDSTLIKQVWENLISNAVKYSANVPAPLIEIGSTEQNNKTVYFVKDNGAGFNMKFYNKLFGVFQRLHNKSEFEGTGVGLALAQRIIKKHGGEIWAESKLNEGTTFYFTV